MMADYSRFGKFRSPCISGLHCMWKYGMKAILHHLDPFWVTILKTLLHRCKIQKQLKNTTKELQTYNAI